MSRRKFTREFKIEAVQLSEESDKPIVAGGWMPGNFGGK